MASSSVPIGLTYVNGIQEAIQKGDIETAQDWVHSFHHDLTEKDKTLEAIASLLSVLEDYSARAPPEHKKFLDTQISRLKPSLLPQSDTAQNVAIPITIMRQYLAALPPRRSGMGAPGDRLRRSHPPLVKIIQPTMPTLQLYMKRHHIQPDRFRATVIQAVKKDPTACVQLGEWCKGCTTDGLVEDDKLAKAFSQLSVALSS